jgi:hypothetical protein
MREDSFFDKIRELVTNIAFRLFLWSIRMTKEQYWLEIYEQEKRFKEAPNLYWDKDSEEIING